MVDGGRPPDVVTAMFPALNELKCHGIEMAAAQCWRSTSFGPTQGACAPP
jgi:hypothetical protein